MAYTEVKQRGEKRYYYRAQSVREGRRVSKKRIYLGADLDPGSLVKAERGADVELGLLNSLLTPDEEEAVEGVRRRYGLEPQESFNERYETFATLFTHNSTAIEGNPLTLQETRMLLFDRVVISENSLKDINEVLNHKRALDTILAHKGDIDRRFILDLHRLTIADTLRPDLEAQIGRFRTVQVYISGVEWMPPTPWDVPKGIRKLLSWYSKNKAKLHPLVLASYFHVGFEMVHPFVDGNGRVGRLLMNLIMHRHGYPMINIPNDEKFRYYHALEAMQDEGDLRPFVEYMVELLKGAEVLF